MLQYEVNVDQVFHALGDPHRRAIVDQLSRRPMSATELAGPLTITLTAVVQHVRVLERCGLVVSSKQGRVRTCRLRPEGISVAEGWLTDRRRMWERKLDRLGTFLEAERNNQGDPQ